SNLASNVATVFKLLSRTHYEFVLADSDYSAFFFKPFFDVPVIALNNSSSVIRECRNVAPPPSVWPQLFIELLDYLFHRFVPDLTLSPTPDVDFERSQGSTIEIPLLSRFRRSEISQAPTQPNRVLFIFSASELGHDPRQFIGLCPPDMEILSLTAENRSNPDGSIRDVAAEIASADIVVSNAGLGTISDAIALEKPILVVPIAGHCEQWANGRLVERLGIGEVASLSDFQEKLSKVRRDHLGYRQALTRLRLLNENAVERTLSKITERIGFAKAATDSSEHQPATIETQKMGVEYRMTQV
ncbi:MAG: glycosyltransferase family protein, partial [Bdellovibrionota bacterium]